jgi:hypothetical protein
MVARRLGGFDIDIVDDAEIGGPVVYIDNLADSDTSLQFIPACVGNVW